MVYAMEDPALVNRLVDLKMPLTVCPLSNVKLCVYQELSDHPLIEMLDRGLNVCVNSDDPPYFGGYLMDNFVALHEQLGLTLDHAKQLAANSIRSSFAGEDRKSEWLSQLEKAQQ